MRVAFDGSVVRTPYSGVQLSVMAEMDAVAKALGDDVRECTFFCRDASSRDRLRAAGGNVGALPSMTQRVMARVLWQQIILPQRLKQLRVSALHALAYTAPLRCPVPYVVNVHDIIALERPDLCARGNRLHMSWLLPRSIQRASGIIVSTAHVADRVHRVLKIPLSRLVVAPLGVDADRFGTPAEQPHIHGLEGGRRYIVYVGNVEPKKDVATLLDGYAASGVTSAVDLVIAGRAAWKSADVAWRLKHWAGPGRVHWLGRVDGGDLPGLLQHASALVMPSIEEGFGMPVLEGMAAGLPVLHSDHPALLEAAGGLGLMFARGDAGALAAHIQRVANEPVLAAELSAAGRERAASMTWARWGEVAAGMLRCVADTRL